MKLFLIIFGLSSGIMVGAGVISLLILVGIIPRMAQLSNTRSFINFYEKYGSHRIKNKFDIKASVGTILRFAKQNNLVYRASRRFSVDEDKMIVELYSDIEKNQYIYKFE